ncbi:UPF0481 protein At3g47200-like [Aristolochia californica]|uniref:UPF0481 protein At3g47200-like n=1 Tax=Aristolochia californica TaxID=171875 RepID=UPI0035E196E3
MGRKFMSKIIALTSIIDNIYDVYGTEEELQLFIDAIESKPTDGELMNHGKQIERLSQGQTKLRSLTLSGCSSSVKAHPKREEINQGKPGGCAPYCTMASQNANRIDPENLTRRSEHLRIEVGRLQRILDNPVEAKQQDRRFLPRVPSYLVERNENLYRPKLVSIGPYHHNQAYLKPMEEYKVRALRKFIENSGKTLDDFKRALEDDVNKLMDSYKDLDAEGWDECKFLELMIVDGCFILEFFRRLPFVPFLVLEKLLAVENLITVNAVEHLDECFGDLLPKAHELYRGDNPIHLLDLLWTKIIGRRVQSIPKLPNFEILEVRSASTYKKAGIVFKGYQTKSISAGIKLENRVLDLPVNILRLHETQRANLLVYENLRLGSLEIHSYFSLMRGLLQSVEDVRLLGIHSLTEAERILNSLKYMHDLIPMAVDAESDILPMVEQLNGYYKASTKKWKRHFREWSDNLNKIYFNNPWTVLSLIGAMGFLAFTLCQTVFSALSY